MIQLPRSATRPFIPPYDVLEQDDQIVILVEIAGMRTEDFNITLREDRLVITGIRRKPSMQARAYHRVEIGYGEFRIDIPISWAVQTDTVEATYSEGFLRINLTRIPRKQIPVVDKRGQSADEADDN